MAVNRLSAVNAYRGVAQPGPTPGTIPANEVGGVAATGAVRPLPEQQPPGPPRPQPYVNTRGETTGTVVNIEA